jgi:hypothetical protein
MQWSLSNRLIVTTQAPIGHRQSGRRLYTEPSFSWSQKEPLLQTVPISAISGASILRTTKHCHTINTRTHSTNATKPSHKHLHKPQHSYSIRYLLMWFAWYCGPGMFHPGNADQIAESTEPHEMHACFMRGPGGWGLDLETEKKRHMMRSRRFVYVECRWWGQGWRIGADDFEKDRIETQNFLCFDLARRKWQCIKESDLNWD